MILCNKFQYYIAYAKVWCFNGFFLKICSSNMIVFLYKLYEGLKMNLIRHIDMDGDWKYLNLNESKAYIL